MLKWQGISEFVAVAETQSFTKAAQKLNVSTAHVSRQLNSLEHRLKVKLLYRTTRKVSLTDVGSHFYQECRLSLDALDNAVNSITESESSITGKISITAPTNYGELTIIPMLNDFILQYPEIKLDLKLTNQRLDLVEDGIDLAIRLGELENSTLMATKLTSRKIHLCSSTDYVKSYGMVNALNDLDKHNCLLGTADHWQFTQAGKLKRVRVSGNLRYNSGYGLLDAALKGIGLIQLPDYFVKDKIQSGELIRHLTDYEITQDPIWAVYPYNKQVSKRVKLLISYLKQQFLSPPN
ncbi:LysR family transcriptional regulator [Catenovulum maritimum]|uniref:LysR family transcriptional regulator n=1 Tax=Catenovulum maritimum TaxID=1513271 RepID=A0A0J8GVJ9_9ALTE|nr:LysR family transcriptional regulator [Catenovulum maritimum]KMT65334.1 LysR family transcriptional regulator [Catenovulum maritimum]